MNHSYSINWIGGLASLTVFIFSFLLFYSDTQEIIGSFFAALFSAVLFLVSFIALHWLIQVFTK